MNMVSSLEFGTKRFESRSLMHRVWPSEGFIIVVVVVVVVVVVIVVVTVVVVADPNLCL
jgi:hypothetical protein